MSFSYESESRVYVCGDGGKVGYYDADTLAWTALTDIASALNVLCVEVVDPDDIWVGLLSGLNGYPTVAHWDGSSWTETAITVAPISGAAWRSAVWAISVVSSTEVYALSGNGHTGTEARLLKYNGSGWSVAATALHYDSPTIAASAGGSTLYMGHNQTSYDKVSYWNGSARIDDRIDGTPFAGYPTGLCVRSGVPYILNHLGDLYSGESTLNTWTLIRDMASGARDVTVNPQLWLDPSDNIWTLTGSSPTVISRWDGSSWSDDSLAFAASFIGGVQTQQGAQVWVGSYTGSYVRHRDPQSGVWTNHALGFQPRSLGSYYSRSEDVEDDPPNADGIGEHSILIRDTGRNWLASTGRLVKDFTVSSRVRFRLLCRRGEYWADPRLGSRLHLLKSQKDAMGRCQAYCTEALRDLIDAGEIVAATVTQIEYEQDTGSLLAEIEIEIPGGDTITLGLIPVG